MGKASSNKKVARAAKAGGGRARAAGERNILFPTMLAAVVILGTLLVVYARDERSAEALPAPLSNEDHWHAAYGVSVCDALVRSEERRVGQECVRKCSSWLSPVP